MDKKVEHIAQEALAQAKQEDVDDEDARWMAAGAVNRAARNAGVIGEELTPEMNAASQAVVKVVSKKHGK